MSEADEALKRVDTEIARASRELADRSYGRHTGEAPAAFDDVVVTSRRAGSSQAMSRAAVHSSRTRWLAFLNDRGKLAYAPGVRTHQVALLLNMGRDWFARAMAWTDEAEASYGQ